MKKIVGLGITAVVILLFLGLAFIPGIDAYSSEDELIYISTEIHAVNGITSHTVKLTKEQFNELEHFISYIKTRLDNINEKDETVKLINEIIIEFEKYGLLGGQKQEDVQRLLTRWFEQKSIYYLIANEEKQPLVKGNENENFLCFVAGYTSDTLFLTPLQVGSVYFFHYLFQILEEITGHYFDSIFSTILGFINFWVAMSYIKLRPLVLGNIVHYGIWIQQRPFFRPAKGWIHSDGLNGKKSWNGTIHGNCFYSDIGMIGFTGIKLYSVFNSEPFKHFYLGSAMYLNID